MGAAAGGGYESPGATAVVARVVGGVAERALCGVDPGRWGDPGDAVAHVDLPGLLVDLGVVPAADEGEILWVVGAAAGPPLDVVGVAGVAGHGAAGDDAAAVSG